VNDSENRVGANEVPGVDGLAAVKRIPYELIRVDGIYATVYGGVPGKSTIELGLVDFIAFLFGLRSIDGVLRAIPGGKPVAGCFRGRRQYTIIGDVVECADSAWRAAGHKGHEARERIRRTGSSRTSVIHAMFAKFGQIWASAGSHAVRVIHCVHTVDANEKNMSDSAFRIPIVPIAGPDGQGRKDQQSSKHSRQQRPDKTHLYSSSRELPRVQNLEEWIRERVNAA
jgi:hypothetical protein